MQYLSLFTSIILLLLAYILLMYLEITNNKYTNNNKIEKRVQIILSSSIIVLCTIDCVLCWTFDYSWKSRIIIYSLVIISVFICFVKYRIVPLILKK